MRKLTTPGFVLVLALAGGVCSTSNARIHTGEVRLYSGDGWDFSDSSNGAAFNYDISYAVTALNSGALVQPPQGNILFTIPPALIMYLSSGAIIYDTLDVAPTDPDLYSSNELAFVGDVLVVRTREGHYAKLLIVAPDGAVVRFLYTYQDDGSTSLRKPVSTNPTTWGRIKSRYR